MKDIVDVPAGIESLETFRATILRIAARNGMVNVRVFGSLARGEGRPESDLDPLVDLEAGRSLLDVIAAKQDIEALIGRKVEVVTAGALRGVRANEILKDAIPL